MPKAIRLIKSRMLSKRSVRLQEKFVKIFTILTDVMIWIRNPI